MVTHLLSLLRNKNSRTKTSYLQVLTNESTISVMEPWQKYLLPSPHSNRLKFCNSIVPQIYECFHQKDWKDIACQQQNARATIVYKRLHGLAPEYLCSKFPKRDSVFSLRDSENKSKVPLPRTNYLKNSFSYSGAITWNNLPCEARLAESLSAFKNLL